MEIRWYYAVIRHSLPLIVLGTLTPGIVALILSLILQPVYQAQAEVVLFKSKPNVTFDERFDTISEDELVRLGGEDPRRQTFSALAYSDDVLQRTIDALPSEWQADWSSSRIEDQSKVESIGNLLQLSVKATSPEEAASVTNAWAQVFVTLVNQAFKEPNESVNIIANQSNDSQELYKKTQTMLSNFLENNQIAEMEFQIAIREQAIENIQTAYQDSAQEGLSSILTQKEQISLLISSTEALRDKVTGIDKDGPLNASTQAAMLVLEVRSFNLLGSLSSEAGIQDQYQFVLPAYDDMHLTAGQALSSLDRLVTALKTLDQNVGEIANNQAEKLLDAAELEKTLAKKIEKLQQEIDQLQGELEGENARLREFETDRDMAWENYLTLENKLSELSIANQAAQTEVVIAAVAITPEEPVGPDLILNMVIGLALGFMTSMAIAFVRAYLDDSMMQKVDNEER